MTNTKEKKEPTAGMTEETYLKINEKRSIISLSMSTFIKSIALEESKKRGLSISRFYEMAVMKLVKLI